MAPPSTSRSSASRTRGAASILAIAGAIAIVAVGAMSAPAGAEVTCDKVASSSGSDNAAGTLSNPYRTAQKLVDSLSAGQTGCLRQGVYAETSKLRFNNGGTTGAPVTLRSYPGERAEIVAQVAVPDTSNHVTLTDLVVNGEGAPPCDTSLSSTCTILPSMVLNGDDVTISNSEITNHDKAICVNAGTKSTERAVRLTMQGNRIHNCGQLPATNHHHGIYLGRADYARITDNLIYDNADRGLQFYPEANHSYVARNVIDGNGSGVAFGGASGVASSDNIVEHNLITNSRLWNVYSWYPASNPVGEGNVVRDNCIYGGGQAEIKEPTTGFTVQNNLFAAPNYADRASGNFDLPAEDPCQSVLAGQDPAGSDGTSGTSGSGSSGDSSNETGTGGGDAGTVDTTITRKPKKKTKRTRAAFRFRATVNSADFECRLDRGVWEPCSSPTTYKVGRGTHRFAVRAVNVDRDAAWDPTPATERWRVERH